jgi:hypothetical protein
VAQQVFGVDNPDMVAVANTLDLIVQQLQRIEQPNLPLVVCCRHGDPSCGGSREGYVLTGHPQIRLCQLFFTGSAEQRIRTLIHEAAHLAGIGSAFGEEYCPQFDGQTTVAGGLGVADAWSHFIHILSGQTPDRAATSRVRRRAPGALPAIQTSHVPGHSPLSPMRTRLPHPRHGR